MELDEKVRWIDLKGELYKMITQEVSDEEKEVYEGGLYESPKTYVNGFALNDGTWVKYIHNGKLWCKNKREVERYLYGYVCFLLKAGDFDNLELWYYSLCFLIEILKYRKGLFGCSPENKGKIDSIIRTVCQKKPSNIKTAIVDKRVFCLDPKLIEGMSVADKTRLQKKIMKELTDARIADLYDSTLSIRKNIEWFWENGLYISSSRLYQWIKEKLQP